MPTSSRSEEKTVLPPAEQQVLNQYKKYLTFPVFLVVAFTFFLGVGAGFLAGNVSSDTHVIIAPVHEGDRGGDRNQSSDRNGNRDNGNEEDGTNNSRFPQDGTFVEDNADTIPEEN